MHFSKERQDKCFLEICERITEGESVRVILKDKHMPAYRTFYKWLDKDPKKVEHYARSCEIRAENLCDQIIEIADSANDITYFDSKGNTRVDWGKVQKNKIQIDARKWVLSKQNPKKYGKKVENTHQGGDKPIDIVDYSKLSPEVLEAIINATNNKSK